MKKYNSWVDKSQIPIGYTLELIPTGHIIRFVDTHWLKEHSLQQLLFLSSISQPFFQFLLKPAPNTRSYDQVNVSRSIFIYKYWGFEVRLSMYVAKVSV